MAQHASYAKVKDLREVGGASVTCKRSCSTSAQRTNVSAH